MPVAAYTANYTNRATIFDAGDVIDGSHVKALYDQLGAAPGQLTAGPVISTDNTSSFNCTPVNVFYSDTAGTPASFRFHQDEATDVKKNAVRITKRDGSTAATLGGSNVSNERNAALAVQVEAATGTDMQPNAIFALAKTNVSTSWDAVAINAVGWVQSSGPNRLGTGAYLEGRKDKNGGRVVGVEVRSNNSTATNVASDSDFATSGASNMTGVWVTCISDHASANPGHGVGVAVGGLTGAAGAASWTVGFAATSGSVTSSDPGAAFRDASSSHSSFRVSGSHTFGINLKDGSFSTAAIALPNNSTIRWRNNANTDDIICLQMDAGDVLNLGSSGVNGIRISDGKNLAVGTTTGSRIASSSSQKLAFWGATPVVQPTAVANATGSGDAHLRLNDLLSRLRTIGIIAT